ncbi:hydroxyacylglutathione hydrolase [Synechococcus sp. RSCCF101]|uniref:hydroxyacylglutathione hydrolase n=1 Tax=Synechococcus sp. RSCCF101 TaxID=2511069 RepID=UPI001243E80F|nr:hydroxyacylglutathione hydrolase [Synechococcus sp. RSCCF101]QEY31323.1 hydroxyacylglutathione hydrolase [Synechococcus sp. RSCCF101]
MGTPSRSVRQADGSAIATQVTAISILSGNYAFVLHPAGPCHGPSALVVDPGEAGPVRRWLEQRGLELAGILQTHHHRDHIGGSLELKRRWPGATVWAAEADRERIPFQDRSLRGGEVLELLGRRIRVMAVPGHTRCHLAYHVAPVSACGDGDVDAGGGELFCGDTLFLGGCGRLFEGTPAQMHASLQQLAALDARTRIWCAHEYTLSNYRWAASERPDHAAVRERLAWAMACAAAGRPTVPGLLAEERRSNLFLTSRTPEELGALRASKDRWQG